MRFASILVGVCPECLEEVKNWSGLLSLISSFDGPVSQQEATAATSYSVRRRPEWLAMVCMPKETTVNDLGRPRTSAPTTSVDRASPCCSPNSGNDNILVLISVASAVALTGETF